MNPDNELIRKDVPPAQPPQNQPRALQRNRGSSVWPYILIGLGALFLLENLGVWHWNVWDALSRFWPVVLIVIGFDLVFGRRSASARALTIAVAVIGLGAIALWSAARPGGLTRETINQPLPSGVKQAEVRLGLGVGYLRLGANASSGALIEGEASVSGDERLERDFHQQGETAYYTLQTREKSGFVLPLRAGGDDLRWDLRLAKGVPINLRLSTGVGEAQIDLSELSVRELNLSTGVGKTTVTMPRTGQVHAEISGGIGETIVRLPAGVAARVEGSSGIGSVDVQGDFQRDGDEYVSRNYAAAPNRVELRVSGGIGRVAVESSR